MTAPELPPVKVAGLEVPATLAPQIIMAFRETYPQETAGLTDDHAAVRAVLKKLVTDIFVGWAARRALAPVEDAVLATRTEYARRSEVAMERAKQAAGTIVDAPPPEETP